MAFHLVCPVVEERVWQSVLRQTDHRWGQTHVQHTHIGDHQRYCMHCTALHCTSNRTTYLDLKEKQEKIPRTLPSLIALHSSHSNDLILSDRSPTINPSSPPAPPHIHIHTHTHTYHSSHPILPSFHPSPPTHTDTYPASQEYAMAEPSLFGDFEFALDRIHGDSTSEDPRYDLCRTIY